jgi:membrane protein Man1
LCAVKNLETLDCNAEQEKTQLLYNFLISEVQDKFIKNQCENSDIKPIMEAKTVFEYISTHENMPSRDIEELIGLFMNIAKTYSDSPIGFDDNAFNINVQPNLPIFCAVKNIFANMFYLVLWLGVGK